MPKFLIIDTFNFFHRAYYAIPSSLTGPDDSPINAVYGVASMLINIFRLIQPDYVVAALESEEETERKKQFEEYKAHRKPMDDELKVQIPALLDLLEGFGICSITVPGYEGDDIIASLVDQYSDGMEVVIASNDRDLWQLVGGRVLVMSPKNGGNKADWIGVREVRSRYGFGPERIVDYKALKGDPSDNIPGVPGVGKVTATKLLLKYSSLHEIYDDLGGAAKLIGESMADKLKKGKDSAFFSRGLAQLESGLDLDIELEDCSFEGLNESTVRDVLEKYDFHSLVRRLGANNGSTGRSEGPDKGKDSGQLGLF